VYYDLQTLVHIVITCVHRQLVICVPILLSLLHFEHFYSIMRK